jgi:hypothetical protein
MLLDRDSISLQQEHHRKFESDNGKLTAYFS